jgi:hypothetical protein
MAVSEIHLHKRPAIALRDFHALNFRVIDLHAAVQIKFNTLYGNIGDYPVS